MHRYLTVVCALSVLILGILTLAFSTHAKRTSYTMQSSSPINVALATNGADRSSLYSPNPLFFNPQSGGAESVIWTNVVGATATGNNITKTGTTGWGNAGASSTQSIFSGDGYVEVTASETSTARMFGLSDADGDQNWPSIDFGLHLDLSGIIYIFESGNNRGTFGTYASGDKLQVAIVGGVVKYRKNGTVFYTSTVAPSYPLLVDTSLYSSGTTFTNVIISGDLGSNIQNVVWTSVVGITTSGNSVTKNAVDNWGNAGAVSMQTIASGDGYVEFTASETSTWRMCGLSRGNSDHNYTDIDFAVFPTGSGSGSVIQVYESGLYRGDFGTYATGDHLRVAVEGGAVKYRKNGTVFYTSTVAPSYPLLVDTSLYSNGSTFTNVILSGNLSSGVPDDVQPTISISDATVNEGNSGTPSAVFNVTLSSASTQTISINYATANGTATSSSDYVAPSGTVTFAPGQTSKPISIQVVGDTAVELNESFFVNLSGAVNATLADGQGVGTILNDDVSISYFEIPVYFHVIRDFDGVGEVPESMLDAQIALLNRAFNSADTDNFTNNGGDIANVRFFFWKAGVDRVSNHGWFEMEPGTPVMPGAEYFAPSAEYEAKNRLRQGGANALNFYTVRGATPLEGSPPDSPRFAWATFAESYQKNSCVDGVVVPFTMLPEGGPDGRFNKGKIGVHEVGHWLGLYHTYQGGCEVINDQVDDTPAHLQPSLGNCTNSPDTCSSSSFAGIDPIHNFMTANFDACKTHFTTGQFLRMKNQYQTQRESNTPPDCPVVTISISDATVTEGNSGSTFADFTVTLSRVSTQPIIVDFNTADGTASSGSDYFPLLTGGTVPFAAEQISLSQTIPVQVRVDTEVEANETFFVNLSKPRNVKIARGQGVGTILNDDALPTISISDVTVNEGNSGNTTAVFTVTLSNPSTQPIDVNYATANGTASSPGDYIVASGTAHFAPQQTSWPISIPIPVVGDTVFEANENFFVNLSNPVNATLADSQGVGTILNDDVTPVYEGWVDIADCNAIIGWAADRNRLNTSITVSIYDGENFVTTVPASDLRSDVGAYLGDNGRHGFAILTPPQFKDGLPHTLRVKFESSTTELSPRTITCVTYYEIVARHSGKCLDVEGESMAAGARVIQFVCGGWTNQQWQVIPVGGGYYKIVVRHSGKVLDVQGAGLDNGTPVWQWDENGTAAQQWQIIDVGGGYVRIVARHSGKVLDVSSISTADGAQIHQWDYVGIANQQWLLRRAP